MPAHRQTDEQWLDKARQNPHITPLSIFRTDDHKVHCRYTCNKCKSEQTARVHHLLEKDAGGELRSKCSTCRYEITTDEEWLLRVRSNPNIEAHFVFRIEGRIRCNYTCKKCNLEQTADTSKLISIDKRRGKWSSSCVNCMAIPQEEFHRRVKENGFNVIGDQFLRMRKKSLFECAKCKVQITSTTSNLLSRTCRCKETCLDRSCYVYVLSIKMREGKRIIKVGIAEDIAKRVRSMCPVGHGMRISIIGRKLFEKRSEAFALEQAIHKTLDMQKLSYWCQGLELTSGTEELFKYPEAGFIARNFMDDLTVELVDTYKPIWW